MNIPSAGRTSVQGCLSKDTSQVVIFDTNGYRNLTFGLTTDQSRKIARELADAELARGTKALVSPFVIWELVAHLADSNDPAYENCMNSLVALVEHTRLPADNLGGVCRAADGETEICRQLFNQIPPIAEQNCANHCKLASYVRKESPTLTSSNSLTNFKEYSAEMDKIEAAWHTRIEYLHKVLRTLDTSFNTPHARKNEMKKRTGTHQWPRISSSDNVGKSRKLRRPCFSLPLSADELNLAAERMEKIFPTSLMLMQKTIAAWFRCTRT